MKHTIFITASVLLGLVFAASSCENKAETSAPSSQIVKIIPSITKVTDDSFETGDAIGVNIILPSGAYATNEKMEYNGSYFSSDLVWYEGTSSSTVSAWYPYSNNVPSAFSVQTNQSSGLSSSDFVSGVFRYARPSETPLSMPFKHRMSRIEIQLNNTTGKTMDDLRIGGVVADAVLADDFTLSASSSAEKVEITPCLIGGNYYLLIPPQTAEVYVNFNLDGEPRHLSIPSATFSAGAQSTIELTTTSAKLIGVIENWYEGRSYVARMDGGVHIGSFPITIDGDFSDWDEITADTADGEYNIYRQNTRSDLDGMLRLKLTSDDNYIYVYTELKYDNIYLAEGGPYSQGNGWEGFHPSHPGTPGPLIIYIGTDSDNSGAFATPCDSNLETFWDYNGFDAYPQYYFLYDVAANRMQLGWNQNMWPQSHDGSFEWGQPLSNNGAGWWGDDVEGTPVRDNSVSDENTFKFSGVTTVKDPISNTDVSVIRIEFAMDRYYILENNEKVVDSVVIGASYHNFGQNAGESNDFSGKLPSGREAVTLMLQ